MNNFFAALIIAAAFLAQPWMPYVFGYSQMEHEASKAICEEDTGRRLAKYLNVSERISTLTLASCKASK